MFTKLFLLSILLLTALGLWILPKTKWAKNLRMNEKTFYISNGIGILFSTLGLIISFLYSEIMLEKHYYELILLPIFLVYIYISLVQIINKNKDIYDEKQIFNMYQAATHTWGISIIWVFLIYAMYKEHILSGLVFFPLYVFFTLCVFSVNLLIMYKKS